MGFDAGSLTAHLKLDRAEFDEGIDKARAKADELDGRTIKVDARMDNVRLDEDATIADETISRATRKRKVDVDIDLTRLAEEAAIAKAILDDIGYSGNSGSLIEKLLGGGTLPNELTSALQGLGYSKGDAQSAISRFAQDGAAMRDSLRRAFWDAFASEPGALGSGASGFLPASIIDLSSLGGGHLGWKFYDTGAGWNLYDPFRSLLNQRALGSGGGGSALERAGIFQALVGAGVNWDPYRMPVGALGMGDVLGPTLNDVRLPSGDLRNWLGSGIIDAKSSIGGGSGGGVFSSLMGRLSNAFSFDPGMFFNSGSGFFGAADQMPAGLLDFVKSMKASGHDPFSSLGKSLLSAGGFDVTHALKMLSGEGGSGGMITQLLSSIGGAGQSGLSSLASGFSGLSGAMQGVIVMLPVITAGILAIGTAAGGMTAGLAIGTGGLLIFGVQVVDAFKNLSAAYTAQQNLASAILQYGAGSQQAAQAQQAYNAQLAGMSPAAQQAWQAIDPLISSFKSIFDKSMPAVYGIITGFASALTQAAPIIGQFVNQVDGAMGGFFGQIDSWMESGNFKSFMSQMSQDVGPIMSEFGTATINLGKAFTGFLQVFGPIAKDAVGPFFDRLTGHLAHFFDHLHITKDNIKDMIDTFNGIGRAFSLIFKAIGPLIKPMADLGVNMLNLFVAASPLIGALLFIGDVVLLGLIKGLDWVVQKVEWLVKEWKLAWPTIKKDAINAWEAIDNNVIHPMVHGFVWLYDRFMGVVHDIENAWDGFYFALMTAWHWIDRDVIHPIERGFDWLRNQIKIHVTDAVNDVTKIWHGLEPVVDWIKQHIVNPIKNLFSGLAGDITGPLAGLFGIITSPFTSAFNAITGGAIHAAASVGQSLATTKVGGSGQAVGGGAIFGASAVRHAVQINVDARHSSNPGAVAAAATAGVQAAIPALRMALAQGQR